MVDAVESRATLSPTEIATPINPNGSHLPSEITQPHISRRELFRKGLETAAVKGGTLGMGVGLLLYLKAASEREALADVRSEINETIIFQNEEIRSVEDVQIRVDRAIADREETQGKGIITMLGSAQVALAPGSIARLRNWWNNLPR